MLSLKPLAILAILAIAVHVDAKFSGFKPELAGSKCGPLESTAPPTPVCYMTNAERLKRGLPLSPPRRRGTPVRRQQPSSGIMSRHHGNVIVRKANDSSRLGYLSKISVGKLVYQTTTDFDEALTVNFALPFHNTKGDQLNLYTENSDIADFSLIGLIKAPDNSDDSAGSDSDNKGIFGGTALKLAAPGALPAAVDNSLTAAMPNKANAESAVWSVDLETNALAPHWVASDGSIPSINYLILSASGGELYFKISGDAALAEDVSATLVTFEFAKLS